MGHTITSSAANARPCFDNAKFNGTTLGPNTHLTGATFRNAEFNNVTAVGIVAQGCDFTDAQMENANFAKADLRNSRLGGQGSDLTTAKFQGANLAGAIFEPGTKINIETLIEAVLDGATIEGVELELEKGAEPIAITQEMQADIRQQYEANPTIEQGAYEEVVKGIVQQIQLAITDPAMAFAVQQAMNQRLGEDLLMAMDLENEGAAQDAYMAPEQLNSGIAEFDSATDRLNANEKNTLNNRDDAIEITGGDFELETGEFIAPQAPIAPASRGEELVSR